VSATAKLSYSIAVQHINDLPADFSPYSCIIDNLICNIQHSFQFVSLFVVIIYAGIRETSVAISLIIKTLHSIITRTHGGRKLPSRF
jgi:hypothetical protein